MLEPISECLTDGRKSVARVNSTQVHHYGSYRYAAVKSRTSGYTLSCSLYLNESQMFSDIELLAVFPTLQSTIHRYSQHNKVMSCMYVIFVHICC